MRHQLEELKDVILKAVNEGNSQNLDRGLAGLRTYASENKLDFVTVLNKIKDNQGLDLVSITANNGNGDILSQLLAAGIIVSTPENRAQQLLVRAALNEHENIIKILTEAGVNINAVNREKVTAVSSAAGAGYAKGVAILIRYGANVNIKNQYNINAVYDASGSNLQTLQSVLQQKDADILSEDSGGNSCIHRIITTATNEKDKRDMVGLLINFKKIDLNKPNKRGETPAFLAASRGNIEILKLLRENGVDFQADRSLDDLNKFKENVRSVLRGEQVAQQKTVIPASAFKSAQSDKSLTDLQNNFYKTMENNNYQDLVSNFAAISTFVSDDSTQLKKILDNISRNHLEMLFLNAKKSGDKQALQWLIAKGKQYQSTFLNFYQSKLMSSSSLERCLETLSSAGFDVNMKNAEGTTPLNEMAFNGNVKSVELLLQNGADISVKGNTGLDALHCAMYSGNLTIVEKMLNAENVDLTSLDDRGNSLLIAAIEKPRDTKDKQAIVELLILKGVDVNKPNPYGATPASVAANLGNLEYLRLLFIGGANYLDDPNFNNVENKVIQGRYNGYQYSPEIRPFLIEAKKLQEITKLLNTNEFRPISEANLQKIHLILSAAAKNSPQVLIDYYESLYAQSDNPITNYQLAILEQQLLQIRPTEHTKEFLKMMGEHLFTRQREGSNYLAAVLFAKMSHFEDREVNVLLDRCLKQFVNIEAKSGMTWQLIDKNNPQDKQLYDLAHQRIRILKEVYTNPNVFMNDARMQGYINKLRANRDITSEVYNNPVHILHHLISYISEQKNPSLKDKFFDELKVIKDDHDLQLTRSGHKAAAALRSLGVNIEQERVQTVRPLQSTRRK